VTRKVGLAEVPLPGAIGAAVVAAARRCAAIDAGMVRRWERGDVPLYSVPHAELHELACTDSSADAESLAVLEELLIAGQCDLLVREMLDATADYGELPAIDADVRCGLVA
jgi:hypothetical protein